MTYSPPYKRKYAAPSRTHFLVCVDLGKVKLGVAVFRVPDNAPPKVVYADTILCGRGVAAKTVAEVTVKHAAGAVQRSAREENLMGFAVRWVCEWPLKYADKTKYHEDIEALHQVGLALEVLVGKWHRKYFPGKWKGNVPKPAHRRRVRRALMEGGHLIWDISDNEHDTWDALGIGAYALGITERGGARP